MRACACGVSIDHRHYNARHCEPCSVARKRARRSPEKARARSMKWRKENYDRYLNGVYRWAAANKERIRANRRSPENLEKARERTKRWRQCNPEKARVSAACNMGRRRAAPGDGVTPQQWCELLEVHGHRCAYCLRSDVRLTMDHIDPIVRGGWHDTENVVPACKSCNSRKHDLPIWVMLTRVSPSSARCRGAERR